MKIEQASEMDLDEIGKLFRACVRDMLDRGIDQWDESYPNADIHRSDAQNGSLYVVRLEEGVAGCLTMDENQAAEYGEIPWDYREGRVLVLHRLAVHPSYQQQGIARQLMTFAEQYGRSRGYAAIRMDAYSGNHRALPFYAKLGYEKRGEVHFGRREKPFYCFEKSLR